MRLVPAQICITESFCLQIFSIKFLTHGVFFSCGLHIIGFSQLLFSSFRYRASSRDTRGMSINTFIHPESSHATSWVALQSAVCNFVSHFAPFAPEKIPDLRTRRVKKIFWTRLKIVEPEALDIVRCLIFHFKNFRHLFFFSPSTLPRFLPSSLPHECFCFSDETLNFKRVYRHVPRKPYCCAPALPHCP